MKSQDMIPTTIRCSDIQPARDIFKVVATDIANELFKQDGIILFEVDLHSPYISDVIKYRLSADTDGVVISCVSDSIIPQVKVLAYIYQYRDATAVTVSNFDTEDSAIQDSFAQILLPIVSECFQRSFECTLHESFLDSPELLIDKVIESFYNALSVYRSQILITDSLIEAAIV